jgi:general secretion pathway protein F
MKYFIATILTKGKRVEIPLYAKDRKEANDYAKLKHSGENFNIATGIASLSI